jgi:hypothetical protein
MQRRLCYWWKARWRLDANTLADFKRGSSTWLVAVRVVQTPLKEGSSSGCRLLKERRDRFDQLPGRNPKPCRFEKILLTKGVSYLGRSVAKLGGYRTGRKERSDMVYRFRQAGVGVRPLQEAVRAV